MSMMISEWRTALLTVLAVAGIGCVFAMSYSTYLCREQKRAEAFLEPLLRKAKEYPVECSAGCIYKICQLHLGIPLSCLTPNPAAGFSLSDIRQLITLVLLLGDHSTINYGWYGLTEDGGTQRNGEPQLWLRVPVSKHETYIIQCRGKDTAITLSKVFYSRPDQNRFLVTAANITQQKVSELVQSDIAHRT